MVRVLFKGYSGYDALVTGALAGIVSIQPNRVFSPSLGERYKRPANNIPANINRHTGKPHLHRAEIIRRTTEPGSMERRKADVERRGVLWPW